LLRRRAARAAFLAALAAAGCTAGAYRSSADREVAAILAGTTAAARSDRETRMVFPKEPVAEEEPSTPAGIEREPPVPVPEVMSLDDALRIAVRANRDYLQRSESLYLSALALTGARFQFSPRFAATLSYVAKKDAGSDAVDSSLATASATQVLPTGGTVTLSGSSAGTLDPEAHADYMTDATLRASLRQPLLRGVGYEASHETLTQAERDVVYAVRDFSRYREQFLLDVTRRFYDILAQMAVVRNTESSRDDADFQFRRSQALFEIGRQDKLEVLRAENDLLRVRNDLIDARDALSLQVDQLKVFLGLPTTARFEVAREEPRFLRVDVTLATAVEAALANRYDLANARDRLEDADRALRIARRNLLPDLTLDASWVGSSDATPRPAEQAFRDQTGSVGLTLEIPLQRTLERNAFRAAEIALDRERRSYEGFRDEVVVEVRETLRRLRQAADSLAIQERIIGVEEMRAEKAALDFDAGRIGNRDLLEARRSLLDAKNERVRRTVQYELARINLERAMGTLEVESDGTWRVRRAPVTASAGAAETR
jgi:outer membrane protein TolC